MLAQHRLQRHVPAIFHGRPKVIDFVRHFLSAICLTGLAIVVDCSAKQDSPSTTSQAADETPASSPFKLGDMVPAFSPPPLADLDKSAGWQDQPVVDSLKKLRAFKATEPPPL